jgi:hypothetical protein
MNDKRNDTPSAQPAVHFLLRPGEPLLAQPTKIRDDPLRKTHSVSRKKFPNARGPSPAGIFTVTLSDPESIAQTSFENQLTT